MLIRNDHFKNLDTKGDHPFSSGPRGPSLSTTPVKLSHVQVCPLGNVTAKAEGLLTIGGNSIGLSRLWVRGIGCSLLHSCGKLCLPICSHSL